MKIYRRSALLGLAGFAAMQLLYGCDSPENATAGMHRPAEAVASNSAENKRTAPKAEELEAIVNTQGVLAIRMTEESTGWIVTRNGIGRIESGGRQLEMSLHLSFAELNARLIPAFFLDNEHAWAVDPKSGQLYATENGGRRWDKKAVVGITNGLSFVSPKIGWRLTHIDAATGGQELVEIWKTVDGGMHWDRVAATFPDSKLRNFPLDGIKTGIAFTSSGTGWVSGMMTNVEGFPWLYETTDGGQRWEQREFLNSDDFKGSLIGAEAPLLFGSQKVIIPVFVNRLDTDSNRFSLRFFCTDDGGASWSASAPLACGDRTPEAYAYSFVNESDGWTIAGGSLYKTVDGGDSWNKVELPADVTEALSDATALSFINNHDGWLSSPTKGLYRTKDGGLTWIPVEFK
jgi:photosystem II stability/assembly factor-like uncharacterized protein